MSPAFTRIALRFIIQNRPDWNEMEIWLENQMGWSRWYEGDKIAQYIHYLTGTGKAHWVTDYSDDLQVKRLSIDLDAKVWRTKKRPQWRRKKI